MEKEANFLLSLTLSVKFSHILVKMHSQLDLCTFFLSSLICFYLDNML